MTEPKLCRECRYFTVAPFGYLCKNPLTAKHSDRVYWHQPHISYKTPKVARGWFGKCGRKGKLWEAKE